MPRYNQRCQAQDSLKISVEAAFTMLIVSLFQGSIVAIKKDCSEACIRECCNVSCNGCPLRPAAKCSVAQRLRPGWGYELRGMSTKPW